jgi:hypothetical protein
VRRGASWTAAYHPQLTIAAVPRPIRSSVCPSLSVLLSGPGCRPPRRPLSGGAASGRPAVRRCHRGRHCQDAAGASVTASDVRCPPSRFVVWDPAVQPAGVRPVRCPALWCPPGQRPARWCPPPSVQMCPSPPIPGGGVGPRSCGGHPSPQEPVKTRWAGTPLSGSVDGPAGRGRAVLPTRVLVSGASVADPGRVGYGGGACPLGDQAGQAGVRSARGWRRSEAQDEAARGGRTGRVAAVGAGWRPRWVVVVGPAARVGGPGGAEGLAGGAEHAAPARPRLAASAPGSRPAAL